MASSTNQVKPADDPNRKTLEHTHKTKDQSSTHSRNKRSFFPTHTSSIHSSLFGGPIAGGRSTNSTSRIYARPFEEYLITLTDTQTTTIAKLTDGSAPSTETK